MAETGQLTLDPVSLPLISLIAGIVRIMSCLRIKTRTFRFVIGNASRLRQSRFTTLMNKTG